MLPYRQQLEARGNPMFWPQTERAMLASGVLVAMFLVFLLMTLAGQWLPVLAHELDAQVLVRVQQFCIAMTAFWLGLLWLCWQVRRKNPHSSAPGVAVTYLVGPSLLVLAYFNGVHTIATGLALVAAPALGFVMFESRHVTNAMLLAWLKTIVLALMVSQGWVQDAPLYDDPPPNRFLSPTWITIQVLVGLPVGVAILLLTRNIVEALRAREAHVRELSRRDSLTGLWNRSYLAELMQREVELAQRNRWPLALVVVDIDHFKKINDEFGHASGDQALVNVATTLQENLRRIDHIGRYGGEEFLMVLQNCDTQAAAAVAERCRGAIADTPLDLESGRISLSASFGVSAARGTRIDTEALFHAADQALYQAKSSGRNRVEIAA